MNMGKSFHTVILQVAKSWWLRGHLFLLVIFALLGYNVLGYYQSVAVAPIKKQGVISIEHNPTGTVRVLLTTTRGLEPPVHRATPTAKSTIVVTKTPQPVPTATPTPYSSSGNIPGCYYVVTQYYGQNGEQGTDFGCHYHTRLVALWGGTVQYADRTCWNSSCTNSSGGVIIIRAYVPNLGFESTYYLHIDELAPGIHVGSVIEKGKFIALSGGQTYGGNWPANPQWSEGPHLEMGFSAWFLCEGLVHCSGVNVNPLPYIQEAL